MHIEKIQLDEFIARLSAAFPGIWAEHFTNLHQHNDEGGPERDTRVWTSFYRLLVNIHHSDLPYTFERTLETPIHFVRDGALEGLGVSLSPFMDAEDAQFAELELPVIHQTCHPRFPLPLAALTSKSVVEAFGELATHLGRGVYFETLSLPGEWSWNGQKADAAPDMHRRVAWLNSPVCKVANTLEDTLATLTKKRRYKVRQALADTRYRVEVSYQEQPNFEWDRPLELLAERYEDPAEFEYAALQYLWAYTIQQERPQDIVWISLWDDQTLHAVGGFVLRPLSPGNSGWEAVFQCNVCAEPNGTGAILLAQAVKLFSTRDLDDTLGGPEWEVVQIDPTCRTCLFESEFDIYKRMIVNADSYKPLLCVFPEDANTEDATAPFYQVGKGWTFTDPDDPVSNLYGDTV